MASEHPAASSSQQPFAHPQPAPVTHTSHPASPPTKQSLKQWWKGFRPPQKAQEAPGNSPSIGIYSFVGVQPYYTSKGFVSKLPKDLPPIFQENAMDGSAPVIDGLPFGEASAASSIPQEMINCGATAQYGPSHQEASRASSLQHQSAGSEPTIVIQQPEEVSPASSSQETDDKCSVFQLCNLQKLLHPHSRRRSSSILRHASNQNSLQQPQSSTNANAKQRFTSSKKETCSPSGTLITSKDNEVNTLHRVGILSRLNKKPLRIFQSLTFNPFSSNLNVGNIAKYFKATGQQGIFGVPLRESITYANVAISLIDSEGKSYIYGYVPIVVAKCGVYLKEKGVCRC